MGNTTRTQQGIRGDLSPLAGTHDLDIRYRGKAFKAAMIDRRLVILDEAELIELVDRTSEEVSSPHEGYLMFIHSEVIRAHDCSLVGCLESTDGTACRTAHVSASAPPSASALRGDAGVISH